MTLETILQAARNSIPKSSPVCRFVESQIDAQKFVKKYI